MSTSIRAVAVAAVVTLCFSTQMAAAAQPAATTAGLRNRVRSVLRPTGRKGALVLAAAGIAGSLLATGPALASPSFAEHSSSPRIEIGQPDSLKLFETVGTWSDLYAGPGHPERVEPSKQMNDADANVEYAGRQLPELRAAKARGDNAWVASELTLNAAEIDAAEQKAQASLEKLGVYHADGATDRAGGAEVADAKRAAAKISEIARLERAQLVSEFGHDFPGSFPTSWGVSAGAK